MNLEGSLTIETAEKTRRALLTSLEGTKEALVEVSGIQSIDLAGMQLLIALQKECQGRGIPMRFGGKPRPEVCERLENAGFMDKKGACDGPLDLAFRL
jgi:anti-anti-sigma regulatory factor